VRVDIVNTFEGLIRLRSEWLKLEGASATQLPFHTWEWTLAWWRHLRADGAGVRDQLCVHTLRSISGQLVGIAPLVLTERPASSPLRVRHLQAVGADPNLTEIRTLLCLRSYEQECQSGLIDFLLSRAHDWDWFTWESRIETTNQVPDPDERSGYVLLLPATWERLKAGLRRNIRESLRKCYNSLAREGLTYHLEVLDTPADVVEALPEFFRLHTARAELDRAPRHADVFATEQTRAFLTDVCGQLALRQVVRVFRLWVDGRVVATRIGFELSGALYLYYSGWDPGYARYSVMTTLVAEIIQDAIRRGLHSVHLSTGTDVSKTRWGPRQERYTTRVHVAPRLSAHLLHLAYAAATRLQRGSLAPIAPRGLLRNWSAAAVQPNQAAP
jgi:CelD/BcsL family acetyltransferase involved in cellulose biosynthesis